MATTKTLPDGKVVTMPAYNENADIAVINTDLSNITDNINTVNTTLGAASSASSVTGADAFSKISTLNSNMYQKNNAGTAQSPITNLDNVPLNSSGQIVLSSSVSPTGTDVSGGYWKSGVDNTGYSIVFSRQYDNRMFFYNKAGGTAKGWQELALNSSFGGLKMEYFTIAANSSKTFSYSFYALVSAGRSSAGKTCTVDYDGNLITLGDNGTGISITATGHTSITVSNTRNSNIHGFIIYN